MSRLDGRTALVTGGSKGVGRGISLALAAAGATIVVNFARDGAAAEAVVDEIRAKGGTAVAVQADTSDPASIANLFQEARAAVGAVTILVNNAGIAAYGPIEDITTEKFRESFEMNVLGPLMAIKEFTSRSEADGGAIINIVSAQIADKEPGTALYVGSKISLAAVTTVAAREYAPRRIRVNAIAPTATRTERTRQYAGSDMEKAMIAKIPLGRLGDPSDIGRAAVFLASDEASFITGDTLWVSGGQS